MFTQIILNKLVKCESKMNIILDGRHELLLFLAKKMGHLMPYKFLYKPICYTTVSSLINELQTAWK